MCVDTRVSIQLINDLIYESNNKILLLSKFQLVRNEITKRVKSSQFVSVTVTIAAIINSLSFIALIFLYETTTNTSNKLLFLIDLLICLKEILFVYFLFIETSKVNEKSDELISLLANNSWDLETDLLSKRDLIRLSIYASSTNEPITFPLIFKRYRKIDVIIQITGFIITLLFAILKQLIT